MSNLYLGGGKKFVIRNEGDVWEEKGKTWTIKNGLKQTVDPMDDLRQQHLVPLCCPQCQGTMKGDLNKKIWAINQTCFNCLVQQEHKLMMSGKWDEYQKNKVLANAAAFCIDMESALQEFLSSSIAEQHITEEGMKEHWRSPSKQVLQQQADEELRQLHAKIDDYKNAI